MLLRAAHGLSERTRANPACEIVRCSRNRECIRCANRFNVGDRSRHSASPIKQQQASFPHVAFSARRHYPTRLSVSLISASNYDRSDIASPPDSFAPVDPLVIEDGGNNFCDRSNCVVMYSSNVNGGKCTTESRFPDEAFSHSISFTSAIDTPSLSHLTRITEILAGHAARNDVSATSRRQLCALLAIATWKRM